MARRFISTFLLPLVQGGTLAVGRPLGRRGIEALARRHAERPDGTGDEEHEASVLLARSRRAALSSLIRDPPAPALDEATWRIGGAVHNLIALGHPEIAEGVGAEARVERVASAAATLAALGAPTTLDDVLCRHSLLGRLPEIVRLDRTVRYWLGRKIFVGRPPPARILALPRVRGVRVETARRSWLRDVGVPAVARPAFLALTEASPLGEALDPLRLDPPISWGRVLPVLRFPSICRVVAGRMVEIGIGRAGDALADALYRFASLQDRTGPVPASPEAVAFALRFLAHLAWLDLLFGGVPGEVSGAAKGARAPAPGTAETPGRELAVLLGAAAQTAPSLVWPDDVARDSDLGVRFARHLQAWFGSLQIGKSPRWRAALDVAAAAAASGPPLLNAV